MLEMIQDHHITWSYLIVCQILNKGIVYCANGYTRHQQLHLLNYTEPEIYYSR